MKLATARRVAAAVSAGCLVACASVPTVASASSHAPLGVTALSAVRQLNLMTPTGKPDAPVTQAQAVTGVVTLLGLPTTAASSAASAHASATASDSGAIEAAVKAGLMAGWATTANFDPSATMTRIQLAVLATNAMGLQSKAKSLIRDLKTYSHLHDLGSAGYDLGDANVALEEGVVPPVSTTRFAPHEPVTQETLAVALYRMYLAMDVPITATLTVNAPSVMPDTLDSLSVSATNRLGQPLSAAALARYAPTYKVEGPNASVAKVASGAFEAMVQGAYRISAQLAGPFLKTPLTARADIQVYLPPPPPAPAGVRATETTGGIALSWAGTRSATGYRVYEAVNGSTTYAPVSQAAGGVVSAPTTSTTVSGLTAGNVYTFEVESVARFGGSKSAATSSVIYDFVAPSHVQAQDAAGGITLSWTPGSGQTGYAIYEAQSPSGPYTAVGNADGGALGASASSTLISGLTAGDSYTFKVEALDDHASPAAMLAASTASATQYGVSAPRSVTATAVTGGIRVGWTPTSKAVSYQVLEQEGGSGSFTAVSGTDGGTPSATATSTIVSGLTAGHVYAFKVEAVGPLTQTATSGASSALVYDFVGPSALQAQDATGGITLSWTAGSGQTGYAIYEAQSPSGPYTVVGKANGGALGASASSTLVTGLTAGASYTFKVEAQDGYVTPTATLAATTATATRYGVAAPTGVKATEVAGGIQVTWTAPAGAASYQVLEQIGGSGSFSAVSQGDGGTPTSASTKVIGLTAGDTYAFEVEAIDGVGNVSAASAASGSAAYGASGTAGLTTATPAHGQITLHAVQPITDATGTLTVVGPVPSSDPFPGVQISYNGVGAFVGYAVGSTMAVIEGDIVFLLEHLPSQLSGITYTQSTSGALFTLTAGGALAGAAGNGVYLYGDGPGVVDVNGSSTPINAYMSGGKNADTIKVGAATFTAVASSPSGNDYTDNTSLASAINGASLGVTATAAGSDQVTLTANAVGPSGNLALSTDNTGNVSLTGMSGGSYGTVTITFSQAMDTSTVTTSNLSTALQLSNGHSFGSGPTASWNAADTVLTINLGSGATLTSGDTITLTGVTDAVGNPAVSPIALPALP